MFAKKVKSYAKVNLSLNVTGAAGGYHLIDSVLASIDIYDTDVRQAARRQTRQRVYARG